MFGYACVNKARAAELLNSSETEDIQVSVLQEFVVVCVFKTGGLDQFANGAPFIKYAMVSLKVQFYLKNFLQSPNYTYSVAIHLHLLDPQHNRASL